MRERETRAGASGPDAETIGRFVEAYNPKYEWDLKVETMLEMGPVFAVRPRKVIAVDATPGEFQRSATRWQFEPN